MKRPPSFLVLAASLLAAPASAATNGFVVFADTASYAYEAVAGKTLRFAAQGPRLRPDDYLSCAGRVFGTLWPDHAVIRLGPDLKEDRRAALGEDHGTPRLLGCDGRRLYAFADNAVLAFDAELAPAGRVALEPAKIGSVVPSLSADQFLIFEDHAYLLAGNVGDVWAIGLGGKDLGPAAVVPRELGSDVPRFLWIDPDARALVVLGSRRTTEHTPELEPDETRLIDSDYARTYSVDDLSRAPTEVRMREERRIDKPYPPGFHERIDQLNAQGLIIDFRPPDRPEGRPVGVKVLRLSATVPTYAEASVSPEEDDGGFDPIELVVLRAGGRAEVVERLRDPKTDAVWFRRGKEVLFPRSSLDKHLRLQPALFQRLIEMGAVGKYDGRALAY